MKSSNVCLIKLRNMNITETKLVDKVDTESFNYISSFYIRQQT